MDWLNNPKHKWLCFTLNASEALVAFDDFPPTSTTKVLYCVKNTEAALTAETIKQVRSKSVKNVSASTLNLDFQIVTFGDMPVDRIGHLSTMLEVYHAMMSNPANQEGWPEGIQNDIDFRTQELRNSIEEVS